MAEHTTNYNLIKPLDNETADIAIINQNMDTIDNAMKAIETTAGQAAEVIVTHEAAADPHPQYATDIALAEHEGDIAAHTGFSDEDKMMVSMGGMI